MSPTVFRQDGYRFFFFSREEGRAHIHVISGEGEAKYWVLPKIELAKNYGLSNQDLNQIKKIIEENIDAIKASWEKHFAN